MATVLVNYNLCVCCHRYLGLCPRHASLEQVSDAECGLPIDFVIGGFPGVSYPPHAFLPVAGMRAFFACRFHLPVVRALRECLGLGVRMPNFITVTPLDFLY